MNEIIYLEPDEDIVGVISRVKNISEPAVCLVVPRGANISQSVINLKLLKREIEKIGKVVSLVSKDKISKNLASQVGITVYSSVAEARSAKVGADFNKGSMQGSLAGASEMGGIKINRYKKDEENDEDEDNSEQQENQEDDPLEKNNADLLSDAINEDNRPVRAEENDMGAERIKELQRERELMANAKPTVIKRDFASTNDRKDQDVSEKEKKLTNISSRKKPILIISSIILIILLATSVVLLPRANAKVTLKTSDTEINADLIADKSLQEANSQELKIPAVYYEVSKELEKDFVATGVKDVGTKAGGEISFYNDYDPQNSISLANGTALIADGKTFYLDGAITIPPATVVSLFPTKINPGTTKGKIIAKENGDSYNISSAKFIISSFSGAKRENVYGQSAQALTGGSSKEVTVISESDIEQSKQSLIKELDTAIKEEITTLSSADEVKLILSSLRESIVTFSTDREVGSESANFKSKLSYSINEMGIKEDQLKEAVLAKAQQSLAQDEMFVNPSIEQISYEIVSVDSEKGMVNISGKFAGKVGKKIENTAIVDMLAGGKLGGAESRIKELPGVDEVSLEIWPNFWPMLPFIKQRITVDFAYSQ